MADLLKAATGANPVSRIAEGTGKGGLPVLILTHGSGAVCEVYPHGATVTRYTSPTGAEVLWTSESAVFDGTKAIRGGIPVVFPQFGPAADARVGGPGTMAQHGFARTAAWTVDAAGTKILDSGDPQAVLTLADSAATRALWPHAFACSYTVVLQVRGRRPGTACWGRTVRGVEPGTARAGREASIPERGSRGVESGTARTGSSSGTALSHRLVVPRPPRSTAS